jgi:hypothetical protein
MTVAEYLLPGWLTVLRARDPETVVALTAGNSTEVAAAVLAGPPLTSAVLRPGPVDQTRGALPARPAATAG